MAKYTFLNNILNGLINVQSLLNDNTLKILAEITFHISKFPSDECGFMIINLDGNSFPWVVMVVQKERIENQVWQSATLSVCCNYPLINRMPIACGQEMFFSHRFKQALNQQCSAS